MEVHMIWRSKLIHIHVVLRAPSILWKLGLISRVKDYTGLWRSDVKELHTQSLLTEYITWALNSSSSILVPVSSSYMSIRRSRRSFFSLTIPVFLPLRRSWITFGRNMPFSIHVHDVLEQHNFYYSLICTGFHTGSAVDDVGIMFPSVNLLIIAKLYSFYFVKKYKLSFIIVLKWKYGSVLGNLMNASAIDDLYYEFSQNCTSL